MKAQKAKRTKRNKKEKRCGSGSQMIILKAFFRGLFYQALRVNKLLQGRLEWCFRGKMAAERESFLKTIFVKLIEYI